MADLARFQKLAMESSGDEMEDRRATPSDRKKEKGLLLSSKELSCRRRLGYMAGMAGFLLVLAAVVIVVVVLVRRTEPRSPTPHSKLGMSFSDMFNGKLYPRLLGDVQWMPNSSRLYRILQPEGSGRAFVQVLDPSKQNATAGPQWTVLLELPRSIVGNDNTPLGTVAFSPDERFLLFSVRPYMLFRYSLVARYYVMTTDKERNDYIQVGNGSLIRFITWSRQGAKLIVVFESSPDVISVVPEISTARAGALAAPAKLMQPSNALWGDLLRGIPDWLYEEEILNQAGALWCSPRDQHIVFLETDETGVKLFDWVEFGNPSNAYVNVRQIRYPKAGTRNPAVSLRLVRNAFSASRQAPIKLEAPDRTKDYLMQVWLRVVN